MRFIADGMLGRLVRWLRILGHDTLYLTDTDDGRLMDIATTDDRILLTMDTELYDKSISRGITAHLVLPSSHLERLASLASRFNLSLDLEKKASRCTVCNSPLQEISRQEVKGKIPPSSYTMAEAFWECTGCRKFYWQGSHWENMSARLKDAKKLLLSE